MSLSQALSAAISGLNVSQSSLALVAANVANADTPGYVRKTVDQVATAGNGTGIGVRISAVQRQLDQYVQQQLRVENAGASYATTLSQFYDRLQTKNQNLLVLKVLFQKYFLKHFSTGLATNY